MAENITFDCSKCDNVVDNAFTCQCCGATYCERCKENLHEVNRCGGCDEIVCNECLDKVKLIGKFHILCRICRQHEKTNIEHQILKASRMFSDLNAQLAADCEEIRLSLEN